MTPEEQARNIVAWIYHGGAKTATRERMIGVIADAIRSVQETERERCAQIADAYAASGEDREHLSGLDCRMHVEALAAEIRRA